MKSSHRDIRLILGCGEQKEEGWIGIDKADYGQKIIRDIRDGLPFCDNSIEGIKADSILEHIPNDEDFIFVMNECLRVLKSGSVMYIRCPHWRGISRHKDPTHYRDFDELTFSYLEPANKWKYGFDKRWKIDRILNYNNETLEVWLIANK